MQMTERSRLRITAESSTIRMRVRRPGAMGQSSASPSMAEFFGERLLVEGLHEIFVGPGIESAHDEIVLGFGGDHHDLDAR